MSLQTNHSKTETQAISDMETLQAISKLKAALTSKTMKMAPRLAQRMLEACKGGNQKLSCGNGGRAGKANHLANDFIYGAGRKRRRGLRVEPLSTNSAVLTCLANGVGYDQVYSGQVKTKAVEGDPLLVPSYSGNSANVVRALKTGNQLVMTTFAILAFNGGVCKKTGCRPIHIEANVAQIADHLQMIFSHPSMQWLCAQNRNQ